MKRTSANATPSAVPGAAPQVRSPLPESPCPTCGFVSGALRCPRCNALRLTGCSGGCRTCSAKSCG